MELETRMKSTFEEQSGKGEDTKKRNERMS